MTTDPTTGTTVWDVLTAIGTIGAVVVALAFGVWAEIRLLKRSRREQASLVSAWLGQPKHHGTSPYAIGAFDSPDSVAYVRNDSASLIYNVVLHHVKPDEVQSPLRIEIVPPHEDRTVEASGTVGEPWSIPFDLEFTDAAGRTWLRKSNGGLHRQRRSKP